MASASRGQWSGRIGFIFAAAGSAVGLGNIWRFPYSAGENGGGAFVLVYLFFVLAIGVPVLLSELAIGRKTELNGVGAFKKLVPGTWWPYVGGLGILAGFGILAFYGVIAGWTLGYLYHAVIGTFATVTDAETSAALFTSIISNPFVAIGLTAGFMILTIMVVKGGVSGGIERATRVLMPALLIILIILALRSVTLPGASEGIEYLFKPDFSSLSTSAVMGALGQALFSMSLGMGAMITYGSYFPKEENLGSAAVTVAFFDTGIAFLAGLIIFPALFSVGVAPNAGPGLVFVVLPSIFNALPAGNLFAVAFYLLLSIAALTSTISLLEVVVAYFVDEKGMQRTRAAWLIGGACLVLAIPSALSQGASSFFSDFAFGLDFLSIQNILWGNYALSIGALLLCLFTGWVWGVKPALESLEASGHKLPASGLWGFLVRYVCPVAVGLVLLFIIFTGEYL